MVKNIPAKTSSFVLTFTLALLFGTGSALSANSKVVEHIGAPKNFNIDWIEISRNIVFVGGHRKSIVTITNYERMPLKRVFQRTLNEGSDNLYFYGEVSLLDIEAFRNSVSKLLDETLKIRSSYTKSDEGPNNSKYKSISLKRKKSPETGVVNVYLSHTIDQNSTEGLSYPQQTDLTKVIPVSGWFQSDVRVSDLSDLLEILEQIGELMKADKSS